MRMRRLVLLATALLASCADGPLPQWPALPDGGIAAESQYLKGDLIEDLPSYQGGRVLHPWHSELPDRDRFPLPGRGLATDPRCALADDFFRKCRIYLCDSAQSCPSGWTCTDVALQWDPPGSPPPIEPGGPIPTPDGRYWFVYHSAVCL